MEWLRKKRNRSSSSSTSSVGDHKKSKKDSSTELSFEECMDLIKEDLENSVMADPTSEDESTKMVTDLDMCLVKHFSEFRKEFKKDIQDLVDRLEARISTLEESVDTMKKENSELKCQNFELEKRLVHLEQHSRKSNIRVFGVSEKENEDCKKVVADIVNSKLGLKNFSVADIDAAHRLPQKDKSKPKPIIVRFFRREDKFRILKVRKGLKGSGISIQEDCCVGIMKLLNRVENDTRCKKAWVWDGKVFYEDNRGKVQRVQYGSSL